MILVYILYANAEQYAILLMIYVLLSVATTLAFVLPYIVQDETIIWAKRLFIKEQTKLPVKND